MFDCFQVAPFFPVARLSVQIDKMKHAIQDYSGQHIMPSGIPTIRRRKAQKNM